MGFFSQLEQFDRKLTRWYVRWGRWVWRILIAVPVLVVLWNLGQAVWGGPRGGVGNDSNLLIVFYVQIMPDDFVMQLHRF